MPPAFGPSAGKVHLLHPFAFTPLENPTVCSGDENKIPFRANTGVKALREPSRWKIKNLLTGFTPKMNGRFDIYLIRI
jgi:hypothetical protein